MTQDQDNDGPKSVERTRFFENSSKSGFTAALVAGAAGALMGSSSEAAAQTAKEEKLYC